MAVRRFSVFELDADLGELRRHGRRVHLAAQPLKVLALLTARPGETVTRDELRAHLWGDRTFVEFDRGLNFAIAEVRAALNDAARTPRFVETVPRRGYRFIADVHTQSSVPLSDSSFVTPARHPWRRWLYAAAVLWVIAQLPAMPRAHSRRTASPEARAAFERGLDETGKGAAGARRGIQAFRLAARLDPRFAEAHYALADTYLSLADRRELPTGPAWAEARDAAIRAVALEEMPESRQVLGIARLLSDWDWGGARRDLARAVALSPAWDIGLVAYARVLSAAGDDAAAIEAVDRAETVSPACDVILWESGLIHARASRGAEAERKLTEAIAVGPPHGRSAADWEKQIRFRLLLLHAAAQRWEAAKSDALAIQTSDGASASERARFAALEAPDAARRYLEGSARWMTARVVEAVASPTRIAAVHAVLGDDEAALDWLERAAADGDPELMFSLRDPEFVRLRTHRRFRALAMSRHVDVGRIAARASR